MFNLFKKIVKYVLCPWLIWLLIVIGVGYMLKSYRPDLNPIYEITWGVFSAFIFMIIYILSFKFTGALKKETPFYMFYRFIFFISIIMTIAIVIIYFKIITNM